jgi:hypothetical protein
LRERVADVMGALRRRKYDNRQFRAEPTEFRDGSKTIDARHGDIQNDSIQICVLGDERQRLGGIAGLQDYGLRSHLPEQRGETVAEDRVIVDDEQLHPSYIVAERSGEQVNESLGSASWS